MKLFNKLLTVALMFSPTLSFASATQENEMQEMQENKASILLAANKSCSVIFDPPVAYIRKYEIITPANFDTATIAIKSTKIDADPMYPNAGASGRSRCWFADGIEATASIDYWGLTPDLMRVYSPMSPTTLFCSFTGSVSSGDNPSVLLGPTQCTGSLKLTCQPGSVWDGVARVCR